MTTVESAALAPEEPVEGVRKVHFVSLGCPKNRVDSEVMLGHLAQAGYAPVADAEGADVVVVNTCGFIDAAKEESVDAIVGLAELKEEGAFEQLVVAGCLSQRYAPELAKEIPEVDHFLGTGDVERIVAVLEGRADGAVDVTAAPGRGDGLGASAAGGEDAAAGNGRRAGRASLPIFVEGGSGTQAPAPEAQRVAEHPRLRGANRLEPFAHYPDPDAGMDTDGDATGKPGGTIAIAPPSFTITSASPRVATQPRYSAYVKVSEGCSNTCGFCIIPKLRGPQWSRPVSDVVAEVERLVAAGTVEINLIAQDLCAYGKDLRPRQSLAQLLRALERVGERAEHPVWIRCLYAYPRGLTQEVMDVLGSSKHVLPYLDMPLQHIADSMLRRMRRGKGGQATWDLVARLRERVPQLTLRTTFITGMPGETDADFERLCDFVKAMRFERMGVFSYSPEEGTPAATMPNQVPKALADERRDHLMALQQDISQEQQEAFLGQTIEVLVEGLSDETDLLLQARHQGQAPDIDGLTYINSGEASPGDVVRVCVDQAGDYDLVGGIVDG